MSLYENRSLRARIFKPRANKVQPSRLSLKATCSSKNTRLDKRHWSQGDKGYNGHDDQEDYKGCSEARTNAKKEVLLNESQAKQDNGYMVIPVSRKEEITFFLSFFRNCKNSKNKLIKKILDGYGVDLKNVNKERNNKNNKHTIV